MSALGRDSGHEAASREEQRPRGPHRPVSVFIVTAVVAALSMTCATVASASANSAAAWGLNTYGQLGDGEEGFGLISEVPVAVSGLSGITAVSAGGAYSLALVNNKVMAWGENGFGELGNGTTTNSDVPVAVSGLSGVTAVSAGGAHSLALLSGGTVMAWGSNPAGELGNGTTTNSDVPVPVSGLSGVTAISAGAGHSLALLSGGTVMAWGVDESGELGNGEEGFHVHSDVPVPVKGLTGVVAISAGQNFSLALRGDGTVWGWGSGREGDLGDGTGTNSDVPKAATLSGVTAITAGASHALALRSDGTVMSWGDNFSGELGRSGGGVPAPVTGLSGVAAVSAGGYRSMALLSNGGVMIWGAPPLGDGTDIFSGGPVALSSLSAVTAISAGAGHSLAIGPPAPTVANETPHSGLPAGGTSVSITGTHFTGATAVKFGSSPAASFTVNSDSSVTAVAPPGSGTADVTVTGPEGTSSLSGADRFSYKASGPPEFGRCLKVAKGTGKYKSSNCTSLLAGGSYEWTSEIINKKFATHIKEALTTKLEFSNASPSLSERGSMICKGESGTGEYVGTKEVTNVLLTFTGCEVHRGVQKAGTPCSSAGAASGEVHLIPLEGTLGMVSITIKEGKEIRKAGLDLYPAGRTRRSLLGPLGCGVETSGAVIGNVTADKMSLTDPLTFTASKGKQKPEQFEGEPKDTLEGILFGGSFFQMGLTLSMIQTNEEAVEINAFL